MKNLPEIHIAETSDLSELSQACKNAGAPFDKILSIVSDEVSRDEILKLFPFAEATFVDTSNQSIGVQLALEWSKSVGLDEKVLTHSSNASELAAIALGTLYLVYEDVDTAIEELQRLKPGNRPNIHITQLVDDSLDLENEIVSAVNTTFYA